jgi:uncharacterized protein (DUF608 family)
MSAKIDRRKFIAGVGLGMGALKVTCAGALTASDVTGKPATAGHMLAANAGTAQAAIPACAWKHPLGDAPDLHWAKPKKDYQSWLDVKTRTKKGMPLGGIGAGNFMVNVTGSFGPWMMKPGRYEERFLSQAGFHIREEVQGKTAVTRTLATDDVLQAWNKLNPGEADYHALLPRGWITPKVFESEVSLEFFSPIVKDNYRETSLPVAFFTVRARNPLKVPVKLAAMFTFPNAPYTGPLGRREDIDFTGLSGKNPPSTFEDRKGLRNELATGHAGGAPVTAIVMKADDSSNTPGTQGSAWCIATDRKATYVAAWDGKGDGADIWGPFAAKGSLPNSIHNDKTDLPCGALAVEVELAPGAEATIPFVLSWYFPEVQFGQGTRWLRRYTEYFPKKEGQALAIAGEALAHREAWRKAVTDWTGEIADNPAYPAWLKQGGLNELYYNVFGSFWENGCITKKKQFGGRAGQHLAFVMESLEYRDNEALDVRHHYCRTNRDLWPKIERDILTCFADCILDTPDGSAPHNLGSPDLDPFFNYDSYAPFYNATNGIPGRRTVPWGEFTPKYFQQCFAYWHKTGDNQFLDDIWPAVERTYRYQLTTDTDGDGITEMKSDEYKATKIFNATLWIGALEMLKEMAEFRHESSFAAEVQAQLDKARASTEREMWNQELGYYQYNETSNILMADAMLGERFVDVTGLTPVLTPERMTSHYRQLFKRSVKPLMDTNGDGVGEIGVANALNPDSTPGIGSSEFNHHFEVWTGVSYAAAANLVHWGKRIGDGGMQLDGLRIGWGVYRQSWMNEKNCYWFSTPEAWRLEDPSNWRALMYPRVRAIWELLMEVHDPFTKREPV